MYTLLIVDDDADTCSSLSELLGYEGYACACAYDGRAGLRLLEVHRPDLVIVDFWLPDMDAVEFLRAMAASPAITSVPVIITTALRQVPQLDGVAAQLFKPYGIDEVLAVVRKHLPSQAAAEVS